MVIESKRRRQSKSNEYSQIQFLSKHQRPIQNSNPMLHECSLLRAFVAPRISATPGSNHLLHLLPITCFRDRQKRHANLMGAGPRSAGLAEATGQKWAATTVRGFVRQGECDTSTK